MSYIIEERVRNDITRRCMICGGATRNLYEPICEDCQAVVRELKEIRNIKDYIKDTVSQEIEHQKILHNQNGVFKFSNFCIYCGRETANQNEYVCPECKENSSAGKDKW